MRNKLYPVFQKKIGELGAETKMDQRKQSASQKGGKKTKRYKKRDHIEDNAFEVDDLLEASEENHSVINVRSVIGAVNKLKQRIEHLESSSKKGDMNSKLESAKKSFKLQMEKDLPGCGEPL